MSPSKHPSLLLACVMVAALLSAAHAPPAGAAGGSFGGGTGTSTDPYVIEDAEDLQAMADDLDAYYVLGGDIDASATASWDSGAGFMPVGSTDMPFLGRLNGAGHSILGLVVNRPAGGYAGLFGHIGPTGSVRDVALVDCDVTGANYVGALVCYNAGSVSGCQATGDVAGLYRVGGLVGWNNDEGTVSASRAAVNVTGDGESVGGLVGYNRGAVSGCEAAGRVNGTVNYVGGLVGIVAEGSVEDSHATGDVRGTTHTGGLVGMCTHGTVTGSSATGAVSGSMGVGGLLGTSFFSTVSLCFAAGDVTATGDDVGGLIGANGGIDPSDDAVVSDCYATGDVSTTGAAVGGLVGMNRATVIHSYSTGTVSRSSGFGGLVGVNWGGTVQDSFWDNETSGMDTSDGGEGRSTALMMATGTFTHAGWDFQEVWLIWHDETYPFLRWQDAGTPIVVAGPDQTADLGLDGSVDVTFDGSASTDDFGYLVFGWSLVDDGVPLGISGEVIAYTFTRPGVYEVTLLVTDPTGHVATDVMVVTVRDVTPPTANAGPDRSVDEGTTVTFDGTGSSDNEGIVNYTWAYTVEDVEVSFYGVGPSHTFAVPGVYLVTLWVTDAAGNEDEDAMTLTVRDTTPPAADAGPDRSVPVGSNVTLDASASTDNVGITKYSWAIAYEGTVRTLAGATVQFTFGVAGTYEVVVNVSDAAGNAAEGTVVITVVGTGTVSGTVLDKDGKPVEGATVEVVAADGRMYNATTGANGSFSVDVPHGAFDWKVGKKGYKDVSGTSSVEPMGTAELDMSDTPLKKEEKKSPGAGPALVGLAMVLAAFVAVSRRRA